MAEFGTSEDPFIVRVNHGGVANADLEVAIQIAESQELPGAHQKKCIFHPVLPKGLPYGDKVCWQTILERPFIKGLLKVCQRLLKSAK